MVSEIQLSTKLFWQSCYFQVLAAIIEITKCLMYSQTCHNSHLNNIVSGGSLAVYPIVSAYRYLTVNFYS
jgi:hypothetical protein